MKILKKYNEYFKISIDRDNERYHDQVDRFRDAMFEMSDDDIKNSVLENCTEFIKSPKYITRGILDYGDILYFYSHPVKRYSIDNPNYYTTIMDNSPRWKEYPKRGKSFMCLNSYSTFGDVVYLVMPKDGSKWGVAPSDDIYGSFKEVNINRFFNIISHLYTHYFNEKLDDLDYNKIKDGLLKLQQEVKKNPDHIIDHNLEMDFEEYIEKYFLNNDNIFNKIEKMMDPFYNNFLLKDYADIPQSSTREIWTESPCYFIKYDEKDVIYEIVQESGSEKLKDFYFEYFY